MSAERFSLLYRVRFGDLDAMQHMNNVEFLRLAETARIAFLVDLFPEFSPTSREEFSYVVGENHVFYRSPAVYDEEIRVFVHVEEVRRSSVRLDFEMHAKGDGRLVADGHAVLVGYDNAAGQAAELPDEARELFEKQLAARGS